MCSNPLGLPPELLHEIFLYLLPPPSVPTLPFDLIACSMVCITWHFAARKLFDLNRLGGFEFIYPKRNFADSVPRLTETLVESPKYGLVYYSSDRAVKVCKRPDDCNLAAGAPKSFLRLRPTDLSKLRVTILFNPSLPAASIHRFRHLLDGIQSFCASITTLHLSHFAYSYEHTIRLADFVLALAPRLEAIRVTHGTIRPSLCSAMRLCYNLRWFEAHYTLDCDLASLLPAWPNLRHFGITAGALLDGPPPPLLLARHCPLLKSLWLNNICIRDPHHVGFNALFRCCSNLTELRLWTSTRFDDALLDDILLPYGLALRHLDFYVASVTGKSAVVDGRWPNLRSLALYECHNVSGEFVEKVAEACPMLEWVILPRKLKDKVPNPLYRFGFRQLQERGFRNTWTKAKGNGTVSEQSVKFYDNARFS
ncbi:hypothetical protein BC936DRAFT_150044 [Jimgerdemannia flammicorona]|uniref:Uncharacterized protein n=2 Tax=Jimgerdemannia flammicorona TaxID=994334 RepID=A0A433CZL2_9FUNG|nr:hypothetical protein BC936DRAFT_150044 [Jimgerdemannia flammicorona]RUS35270.1 hypothetical protein BC938DRAFT_473386 [Jimgerdemannia flammicorona]